MYKLRKSNQLEYARNNYLLLMSLTVCFQITFIETQEERDHESDPPPRSEIILSVPSNSTYLKKLVESLDSKQDVRIVSSTQRPLIATPADDKRRYLGLTPPFLIMEESHYVYDINYPAGVTVSYRDNPVPINFGAKVAVKNIYPMVRDIFVGAIDRSKNSRMAFNLGGSLVTGHNIGV